MEAPLAPSRVGVSSSSLAVAVALEVASANRSPAALGTFSVGTLAVLVLVAATVALTSVDALGVVCPPNCHTSFARAGAVVGTSAGRPVCSDI